MKYPFNIKLKFAAKSQNCKESLNLFQALLKRDMTKQGWIISAFVIPPNVLHDFPFDFLYKKKLFRNNN